MNEWMLVGIVVVGTVLLLGGGGWITSIIRSNSNKKDAS
jgi:putative effector of murein hydrolase LrgA (UPF0299 family)|tara:strand:- start:653 stop:769 length:117 start_codon:yes stop_codon:yes gene_type:complete